MAEGRMLKRNISDSKKLGDLRSDSGRLLYTWLIPWTDCEGRYTGDPELIKGRVFPKVRSMTVRKIETLLIELHDIELIDLYEIKGEWCLQLRKTLQVIRKDREKESEIPPPPGGLREDSGGLPLKLNKSKSNKSKLRECDDLKCSDLDHWECQFKHYWNNHPKPMGKIDTRSLFLSLCRKGLIKEVIKGYYGYIEYLNFQMEKKNFKQEPMNSARFLRKENWKEFIGFKNKPDL